MQRNFRSQVQDKPMERRFFFKLPHVWSFTTYFAEGLPYTIIRIVSSVFFRDMRVSLEAMRVPNPEAARALKPCKAGELFDPALRSGGGCPCSLCCAR